MILAAHIAQPTFLQQFTPLAGGVLALIGALVTLFVTGRREIRRSRLEREDDYRREQRLALADVMRAAHAYRQDAGNVGMTDYLLESGDEQAALLNHRAEDVGNALLNQLTVAKLVIHESSLQAALDAVFAQWALTRSSVEDVMTAFWARDSELVKAKGQLLENGWPKFAETVEDLQNRALEELRPTIVSDKSRRR